MFSSPPPRFRSPPHRKRLVAIAEQSPGPMYVPLECDPKEAEGEVLYEKAGCNLFTQTPEIKNWLCEVRVVLHVCQ